MSAAKKQKIDIEGEYLSLNGIQNILLSYSA